MTITMYDLAGAEASRRFGPFCWRSRMALAHKGLAVETVPWRFIEKGQAAAAECGPGAGHR
jgi:glutathione S-transferase